MIQNNKKNLENTVNIYSLPFKEEKDKPINAFSDSRVHYGNLANAVDFELDSNIKILAARGGKVIEVKDDSNQGGFKKNFNIINFKITSL